MLKNVKIQQFNSHLPRNFVSSTYVFIHSECISFSYVCLTAEDKEM